MPLPGESIITIHKILNEVHAEMGLIKPLRDKVSIGLGIMKAVELLTDEEMEILRFGDVTRIADDTYEPYQTVKKTIAILGKNSDSPNTIRKAIDTLGEYIESEQFPIPFLTNQSSIFN